jgi:hypothetical protein
MIRRVSLRQSKNYHVWDILPSMLGIALSKPTLTSLYGRAQGKSTRAYFVRRRKYESTTRGRGVGAANSRASIAAQRQRIPISRIWKRGAVCALRSADREDRGGVRSGMGALRLCWSLPFPLSLLPLMERSIMTQRANHVSKGDVMDVTMSP